METVIELFKELADKRVRLSIDAGELNCFAPKGTLTTDIKKGITKFRAEIIAILEGKQEGPSTHIDNNPSIRSTEFPLSAGQKGLYILQKLHPKMSAYNVPLCFKVTSEIN